MTYIRIENLFITRLSIFHARYSWSFRKLNYSSTADKIFNYSRQRTILVLWSRAKETKKGNKIFKQFFKSEFLIERNGGKI